MRCVYLVRHAHAGTRGHDERDIYRPLTEVGWDRAEAIAALFADSKIDAIWSSTATRCVQTVEPLAAAKGLEIIENDAFWETAPLSGAFAAIEGFFTEPGTGHLVVSAHGNLIPEMVDLLASQRVPIAGCGCEKGSIWALVHDGETWTEAVHYSDNDTAIS